MTDAALSPEEAAAYLGCKPSTARELMRTGRLRHFRVGKLYRTRTAWLDEFMDEGGTGEAEVRQRLGVPEARRQVDSPVGHAPRGRPETPPPTGRGHRGPSLEADEHRAGIPVEGPPPRRNRRRVLGEVA
jgi:excisionase family DNA binding protein